MKKVLRLTLLHVGTFASLLTVLWLMLLLACAIPNSLLQDNFENSANLYKQAEPFAFQNGNKWNSIADNYADSILLGVSWYMGEGEPLLSSINTRYNDGGEIGENYGLYASVYEQAEANTDYTRYWHGSAVFVRLLHLFTNAEGVKLIGFCAIIVLVLLNAAILVKNKHHDIAVMLLLSLILVQFWNVRLSLEFQPSFVLAFILCSLYLYFERKSDTALTLLSLAGGVSTAFFDFLTTETMTLLLPLILVIAVRAKENRLGNFKTGFILILKCGICWGCAYAAAFLVKWILAAIITGSGVLNLAIGSVAERIGGKIPEAEGKMNSIFDAVFANITVLLGGTERVQMNYVIVGTVLFFAVLASVWYLLRAKEQKPEASSILAILAFVVPLRYIVLNNHSYLHEFFTYRALISTILAVLLILVINIELPSGKTSKRKGNK